MKGRHEPLQPARLAFDELGTPASAAYGDVYHSRAGALEQARHVFIRGNGLPERWAGRETFTVCETGFGLGNNFLALWGAWRDAPQRPRRLHVLSFEAHPFSRADLAAALAGHTGDMRERAQALVESWPLLLPGLHRLEFEGGSLTLTLALGRVEHLARQVDAGVDAFFLDGFSPSRNPAMWSRELFGQLMRIANQGATAATWCSAGQVRRDLSAAGFVVTREPGFGGKRQMSCATLRPGLGKPVPQQCAEKVLVVGGGLAGAGMAHSLALRGHAVTVLDPAFQAGPAGAHEGHRAAAMTPAISRDDNPLSRLSRAGVQLNGLRWKKMEGVYAPCGTLVRVAEAEQPSWKESLEAWAYPWEWAEWCEAGAVRARTGLSLPGEGVWLGAGALLRPTRLVPALLSHELISIRPDRVAGLRQGSGGWQALAEDETLLAQGTRVVVAAAAGAPGLLAGVWPVAAYPKLAALQRMAGQIAYFRAGGAVPAGRAIVAGAGYWLPQDEGVHVGGSTYDFDALCSEPTAAGFSAVSRKVADLLGVDAGLLKTAAADPDGWAGWRVAVSDHLPVIGPVDREESLWLACAYGSRGLSWMTLAGEIMAARLTAEPQVLERELLKAIRPR